MTGPSLRSSAVGQNRVRVLDPLALSERDQAAWLDLEARAAEPNAYLSPCFVLPALRHLDAALRPRLIVVERDRGGMQDMVALALVGPGSERRLMPLPYLEACRSRHTYLDGPLIDASLGVQAATCLIDALARHRGAAQGMVWHLLPADGAMAAAMQARAADGGVTWQPIGTRERPVLTHRSQGLAPVSPKEAKERARCWRRLRELGEVRWHSHRHSLSPDSTEAFLRLEHGGWKGAAGTSLLSSPSDAAFFREMVAAFAGQGRAWFTELRLNGEVIASTSNMVSGCEGFAFKVGWDPALRRLGVGVLNEAELVARYGEACPDLACVDSGAADDTFIAEMWPERRQLLSVFLPLSRAGQAAWWLRQRLVRAARGRAPEAESAA